MRAAANNEAGLLVVPIVVAGYAGVTFAVTAPTAVLSGTAGAWVLAAADLGIPPSPGAPLHLLLLRAAAAVLPGTAVGATALAAALLSTLTVLAVYGAMYQLARRALAQGRRTPYPGIIAHGAAAIAALFLAFSERFWDSASRSDAAPTALLLGGIGMGASALWLAPGGTASRRYAQLAAYAFGLGCAVDGSLLLAALPAVLFGGFRKAGRTLTRMLAAGAGALLLLLAAAVSPLRIIAWPGSLVPLASSAPMLASLLLLLAAGVLFCGIAVRRLLPALATKSASTTVLLFLLGLSTALVLPQRAAQKPATALGEPATTAGHAAYAASATTPWQRIHALLTDAHAPAQVMERVERGFLLPVAWNTIGREQAAADSRPFLAPGLAAPAAARAPWPKAFYALPLLFGLAGMFQLLRLLPAAGGVLLASFLALGFWQALAEHPSSSGQAAPFIPFALFVGAGAAALLTRAARARRGTATALVGAFTLLFVALPLHQLRANWPDHDRSGDLRMRDYAYNLLQSCDADAVLLTGDADDSYPALVLQRFTGIRRDVTIVNLALLGERWYAAALLPRLFPGARAGGFTATQRAALLSDDAERLRALWNDTTLAAPPWSARERGAAIRRITAGQPSAARLAARITAAGPALPDLDMPRTSVELRRRVLLRELFGRVRHQRPVYVSVCCPPSALPIDESALCLEGLAWRATPLHLPRQVALNSGALLRQLLTPVSAPAHGMKQGFLFSPAPVADPLWFGAIDNQRAAHLRLAEFQLRQLADAAGARRTLGAMERRFPRAEQPLPFRAALDAAVLLRDAGDQAAASAYCRSVIVEARAALRRGEAQPDRLSSPWRSLYEAYRLERRDDEARDLLRTMARLYPRAGDIPASPDIHERQQ
jgi:hypothetical protein